MNNIYDVLVPWCQTNNLLSLDEQWTLLNTKSITVIQPTPISLRTLMAALTPEEYVTAKTILSTAAAGNILIADALAIMSNVGPWEESGLDIGAAAARGLVDALFTGDYLALGTKVKSLAEVSKSQIEVWQSQGYGSIEIGNLASARTIVEGAV